jgi:CheY-like chemotaxis protein
MMKSADETRADRNARRVLLVEDDEGVRKLIRLLLGQLGYEVVEARNGEEALGIGQASTVPFRLLITDLLLPGMTGREVAGRLAGLFPGLSVVYLTGCTDSMVMERGVDRSNDHLLRKPFKQTDLAETIRQAMDA